MPNNLVGDDRTRYSGYAGSKRRPPILRRSVALLSATMLFVVMGTLTASSHYLQPPGDKEAAPAVVQVQIRFNFTATLQGSGRAGLETYELSVPGPTSTGAIFNPGGAVITTRAALFPAEAQAQITAANTAFSRYHSLRWQLPKLRQKQRVRDADMNRMLQQCYLPSGGQQCRLRFNGRSRRAIPNTDPSRSLPAKGQVPVGDGLAVLSTNSARDRTPTVGIGAPIKADAPYVALGYDTSGKLSRVRGSLEGGSLRPAQATEISTRFSNSGEGAVLVDPDSKGTVIAVLTASDPQELSLSAPKAPIENAGYRIERGVLDGRIDQALGYFTGQHYTHALPLLESVTKILRDRELLADLATAKKLSGTPADKSEQSTMTSESSSRGISRQSLLLILAGLGALALALVVVLVVRRRRDGISGSRFDGDETSQQRVGAEADRFPPDGEEVTVADPQAERSAAVGTARAGTLASPKQPSTASSSGGTEVIQTGVVNRDGADQYCSNCGVSLVAGDRFCYHCGTPVR